MPLIYPTMRHKMSTKVMVLACLVLVFCGMAGSGALADVSGVEEAAGTIEAEDQSRKDAAGVRITMTGVSEDTDDQASEDSAGIRITMTGKVEEEEEDDAWPEVNLAARTGSPDGG